MQHISLNPFSFVQKLRPMLPSDMLGVGRIGWIPGLSSPSPGVRRPQSTALGEVLARAGALELRLARTMREIRQAQRLRYRVFCEEMSASASPANALMRRDVDEFDAICDHLLVLDHSLSRGGLGRTGPRVVGTYRLLRQDVAETNWGFYSAREFDITAIMQPRPDLAFLELGRSCVLKSHRDKRTVELLWQGIWAYVRAHSIDVMLGCASLEGTDPDRLALPLAYLHHFHRAPEIWRARALADRCVAMDRMARETIDPRTALRSLPPLIKGYLRLGAMIGDGAVIDRPFGTTDVLVVLPVSTIGARYIDHYGGAKHSAA